MVGIIVDSSSLALGALVGTLLSKYLSRNFVRQMNQVFGICAMGMGINSIILVENLPAVVLAVVLGTVIGLMLHLGEKLHMIGEKMESIITHGSGTFRSSGEAEREAYLALLVTAIVLFCANGTGIYGSLDAGMTGNLTILLAKAVLDFFTAIAFACTLGSVLAVVAVPQFCVFTVLFLLAKLIFPLTTPSMIADFKSVGGFLLIATGCRIAKMEDFPIADMIPAMLLVMPISWMWTSYIVPLM